jgi:hypothetical protein
MEASAPGELVQLAGFHIGRVTGTKGRGWQHTAINVDTCSSHRRTAPPLSQVDAGEADYIGDLLLQLLVGAEAEAAGAMGLEVVIAPGSEHGRPADPDPFADPAFRSVGLAFAGPIQGDVNYLGYTCPP